MQAESLAQYLEQYSGTLIQKVEENSKPLLDEFHRPDVKLLREPFDAQWLRIMATVKAWQAKRKGVVLSAQMGTGKTVMSIVAVHVHANGQPYRAIITCPPHLQRKWVREVEITVPGAKCRIVQHYSDVLKIVGTEPTGPEFWIMSGNKAKLATKWVPAFVKQRTGILHCPDCDAEIQKRIKEDGADVWVPAQPYDLDKKQCKCEECGGALYQWTKDVDRWPVANIIHKQARKAFRYLIIDESHQSKGERTAAGLSIGRLAAAVPYKVALTGTLLNGYADSVFPMSWRLFPKLMANVGVEWGDTMGFTRRFGRVETIVNFKDQQSYANRQSRGGGKTTTVRVKPGIVPTLYGECLMENSVFCSLDDLGYKLPNLTEFLHPVAMDSEMSQHYSELEDEIRSAMRQLIAMGSKAAIAVLLNTLNGWPDHPYGWQSIGYRKEDGEWVQVAEPPDLEPDVEREKQRKLVEIVSDAVQRGRQVWVYCEMTVKRDVQVRLKELLEAAGLRVKILRAGTVSTVNREDWIRENCDVDVMISNPALVETGMDLFDRGGKYNFSTLVFYQTGYKLDTLRQASARAHRIGQWLDCETHYLFYAGTMQDACIRLMSQKTIAAAAVEGKFSESGLAAMTAGDESVAMVLAKRLVSKERTAPSIASLQAKLATNHQANLQAFSRASQPEPEPKATESPALDRKSSKDPLAAWWKYPEQIRSEIQAERQGTLTPGWAKWRLAKLKTQLAKFSESDRSRFLATVDMPSLEADVQNHVQASSGSSSVFV